jgi:peptide/nickel transport system permease protein
MRTFIIRRLVTATLSLLGVTIVVFSLSRFLGDPRVLMLPDQGYGIDPAVWEKAFESLHLDDPVPIQYGYWLFDLFRGNLGLDLQDRAPLAPKLPGKFMPTFSLALFSWLLASIIGIPLGVLSAVKRGGILDYVGRTFAVLGQTLPTFWIGILGVLVFAVMLGWLPSGTMGEGFSPRHFVLPTVTLGWFAAAGYVRLVRSAMLDVMDSEYIKLARAKGVGTNAIVWKHGFRNAAIAPLTYSGLLLGGLISGSVAVETVFAWPGIARYAVTAVQTNNFTVVAVVTLIFTAVYVVTNFFVDILYAFVDPRIRYS